MPGIGRGLFKGTVLLCVSGSTKENKILIQDTHIKVVSMYVM